MIALNPFTPKSGQEPKIFMNREDEINFFDKRLDELLNNYSNHYILNGSWGIGKTSLLKYLKLYAQSKGFNCAYFTVQEFSDNAEDKEITVHILQSISRALPIKLKKGNKIFKSLEGFGVNILGTGFQLNFNVDKNKILDSQTLLLEGLINIWKELKNDKGIIILIDDVQNLSNIPRFMTILKNVLSTDELIKNTKYLFVLSSTNEGWQHFMKRNHPIGRFFIPRLDLKPFDKNNTIMFIKQSLDNTGIKFDERLLSFVWDYTKGHLFEIHSLCRILYDYENNGYVDFEKANISLDNSLSYLGNTIFDNMLFSISDNEKKLLYIISTLNKPTSIKEIETKLNKNKIKGINEYLRRLVEKEIINNPKRGAYWINDILLRMYINKLHR